MISQKLLHQLTELAVKSLIEKIKLSRHIYSQSDHSTIAQRSFSNIELSSDLPTDCLDSQEISSIDIKLTQSLNHSISMYNNTDHSDKSNTNNTPNTDKNTKKNTDNKLIDNSNTQSSQSSDIKINNISMKPDSDDTINLIKHSTKKVVSRLLNTPSLTIGKSLKTKSNFYVDSGEVPPDKIINSIEIATAKTLKKMNSEQTKELIDSLKKSSLATHKSPNHSINSSIAKTKSSNNENNSKQPLANNASTGTSRRAALVNSLRLLIALAKKNQNTITMTNVSKVLQQHLMNAPDRKELAITVSALNDLDIEIIEQEVIPSEDDFFHESTICDSEKTDIDDESDDSDYKADELLSRSADPVRIYLKKMGAVPLLSREGEVQIAKKIEAAENRVLNMILSYRLLMKFIYDSANLFVKDEIRMKHWIKGFDDDKASNNEETHENKVKEKTHELIVAMEDCFNNMKDNCPSILHKQKIFDILKEIKINRKIIINVIDYVSSHYSTLQMAEKDIFFHSNRLNCDKEILLKKILTKSPNFLEGCSDQEWDIICNDLKSAHQKIIGVLNQYTTNTSSQEMCVYFKKIITHQDNAESAKREMVKANLRLVVSIAKKYSNRGVTIP